MKPAPLDYAAPKTVPEAVSLLASADDAKALAGGQSLVPLLALRLARPTLVVDLNQIAALGNIDVGEDGVRFGALVRQSALIEQRLHPMVSEAATWIAHAAIRSRGTIGGSLAHADSAAELPVVAMALGARMHATGPDGSRSIRADDFFIGLLQTNLAEHELLTSIDLPLPKRWGFAELARRKGDFALVLVAVAEFATGWRIVVGGIEGTPRRCIAAEAAADIGDYDQAARIAGREVEATDHLHATATYQRGMTTEMTRRALASATSRGVN